MRRPWFSSKEIAVAVGIGGFLLGWFAFYDAFEGRGRDTPTVLRPFTWW